MMITTELQSLYSTHKVLTDSEMVADQQLIMQLSDEDNDNCINRKNKNKNKNNNDFNENEESSDRSSSHEEISSKKKIEEIFGKEEEFIIMERPRKKRFRSLQSIYNATKPIKVRHGKNHYEVRKSKKPRWRFL